jgi:hypothetical protein
LIISTDGEHMTAHHQPTHKTDPDRAAHYQRAQPMALQQVASAGKQPPYRPHGPSAWWRLFDGDLFSLLFLH